MSISSFCRWENRRQKRLNEFTRVTKFSVGARNGGKASHAPKLDVISFKLCLRDPGHLAMERSVMVGSSPE